MYVQILWKIKIWKKWNLQERHQLKKIITFCTDLRFQKFLKHRKDQSERKRLVRFHLKKQNTRRWEAKSNFFVFFLLIFFKRCWVFFLAMGLRPNDDPCDNLNKFYDNYECCLCFWMILLNQITKMLNHIAKQKTWR